MKLDLLRHPIRAQAMDLRILLSIAFVATASAAPLSSSQCARQCDGVQPFESQKTYKYSYSIETTSFVNDSTNTQDPPRDASVLKIQCNVEIVAQSSCEVFLRVKDVNVNERSSSGAEIISPKKNEIKSALEAHWLRFAFVNGIVKDVCPEEGEDKWTLNIKRGILSALQSPVPQIPQDVKQPMTNLEMDVTGLCPVYLSSNETGFITKKKDFEGCKDRTKLEGSIQAVKLSPYAPLYNVMESSQECDHLVRTPFIVQSSACTEHHRVRPFSKHQTGVVTTVEQTLEFLERVDHGSPPTGYMQERRTTIVFEHPEITLQTDVAQDAKTMLFNYCQSFSEDDKQQERPEYFSELVRLLNGIDNDGFNAVSQYVDNPLSCRFQEEQVKKFFIDAVAMCESTACVNGMIAMLARPDVVKSSVAELWVSSLPFIQKPTSEMIPTLMNLVKAVPVQPQVFLAVSSLIHNFCTMETVDCSADNNFRNALVYFENALDHDCSPSGEMSNDQRLKLIVALKAIGNIGILGDRNYLSGTLIRCMQRTNDVDIRLAAIEAFHRLPCIEAERLELTNLYKNTAEDTELRIAAYLAMMQCADELTLEVVVETMEIEPDDQVGSFVVSHLKNLNETSDPQKQDLKKVLRNSIVMRKFSGDIRKISRNYEVSWFNEKTMTGTTLESNVIFSKKSFLPRSGSVNATADIFGYAINVFEVGGRMEGMQHLLESFVGPTGYFTNSNSETIMQSLMSYIMPAPSGMPDVDPQQDIRYKRDVDQNRMENIVNQFNIPQEDKPMASVYMKIFGNEVGFMDYDAMIEKFNEWKTSANFMQLLSKLSTEQTIDISRSNKIVKVSSCIPTIAGLPLKLTVDGNSVTHVTASGRLNILGFMMAPRSLHIEGSIKPSIAVELSTTLEVDAFYTRTGLNHVARLHSDTILDGAIIVEDGNSLRVKMNVPEEKQTIIDVSSKIFRFHQQDKVEIMGDPDTQFSQEICSAELVAKYLGVRFCSEMTFPTMFSLPGRTGLLLAGPADLKITLVKVDPRLTSFNLDVSKMLNREMINDEIVLTDVMRLSVGTPDTGVARTYQVDYSYNRNEKHMLLDLQTPFTSAIIDASVIREEQHKKLDVHLRVNPNSNKEQSFRMVAEQEIEFPSENVIRFIPRFEFIGPRGGTVQLQGSVINDGNLRRTTIDLQVVENSETLISLNGPITRTEGTKKSAYSIEMTVEGRYLQGKLTGLVNRNKDAYIIDIDVHNKENGQLVTVPWASVSVVYGSNREDIMFRLVNEVEFTSYPELNFHFEVESQGTPMNHENTVKLCYKGTECNTDYKVVFVENFTASMTSSWEATQSMHIRFNHPAQSKQYEMIQNFNLRQEDFNWTCSLVDNVANTDLFTGAVKYALKTNPKIIQETFFVEMATPLNFYSMHVDHYGDVTGNARLVSTLRYTRESTVTITLAFVPSEGLYVIGGNVDLDIVLADQREINIGVRLDYTMLFGYAPRNTFALDLTVDKFGVQNYIAINARCNITRSDIKVESRVTVDIQTPLETLQNTHLEGGVKRENNILTSDIMLKTNPDRPAVGVEFVFTDNRRGGENHGEVDLIFTTNSHSITLSGFGGYQRTSSDRVYSLLTSINLQALGGQSEGKTFGFDFNYFDRTDEQGLHHTIDARGYAPNHEVSVDTTLQYVPLTSMLHSFDFKWVKDQQGLSWEVNYKNTSDGLDLSTDITLPQQNLVVTMVHVARERFFNPSIIITLNNEEKANVAFTYTTTLKGEETICNCNLNVVVHEKKIIWDATLTRVDSQIRHLESSITHNQDTEASLSILFDITPVITQAAEGVDVTFNIVSKYIMGYDTNFQLSRMHSLMASTVDVLVTVDGQQKIILNLGRTLELAANAIDITDILMNIDINLSFPDIQDEIFRNLAMNVRTQLCLTCNNDVVLKWGNKGLDQTITINQGVTLTSYMAGDIDLTITHPFILPLIYPTFSLGVDYSIDQPNSEVKFEVTTADSKKAAIKVVYQNTTMTPSIKQAVEIVFIRTDKDDIKIKGELKALSPNAVVDMTIKCEYSATRNEHIVFNTKLVNRSDETDNRQASEVEIHLNHPVSNIQVDMFININNDTRDISMGLEGAVHVGPEQGAITLEGSWDKQNQRYEIHYVGDNLQPARVLDRETYEVTFSGSFEDKSYGDYLIYELDMMSDYNGRRVPSFFKIDGRDKEIEYDVNFNPDDKSDYYRFKAGYLNSSAIQAKIDTRQGLSHIVNASVLLYLQAPKVIYTQINWHPEWLQDLNRYYLNKWDYTSEKLRRPEVADYYSNQALSNLGTQWETFKALNQEADVKWFSLEEALQAKIEQASERWVQRGDAINFKWRGFTIDIKTAASPYIVQAYYAIMAAKATLPLIVQTVQTEATTYFAAAKEALDIYNMNSLEPIYGSMMMNIQELNTSVRADFNTISEQFTGESKQLQGTSIKAQLQRFIAEKIEDLQLEGMMNGIQIVTYAKQLNESLYSTVSERVQSMKETLYRNAILEDVVRWKILISEIIPIQQWNDTLRAFYTEVSVSHDVETLSEFIGQLEQLMEERRFAYVEYMDTMPQSESWLKIFLMKQAKMLAESQPNYKLIKADIENGEIIVLLYPLNEVRNLQEWPPAWKLDSVEEMKRSLGLMAPLLQNQVRTQIMDPQLQEIGIFEAAHLLNVISNNQNLSYNYMCQYARDVWATKYWRFINFLSLLKSPNNGIPPYDANAMIVHNQHFMTFDRRFYEFAGRCTYLLAHDFLNGNFSIYVDYSSSEGEMTTKTLIVQQDQQIFTINPKLVVTDGNRIKDLPLQVGNITITREHNHVKIHNSKGISVTCTTPFEICHVSMSGWYYGQTAGLFGTYDYQATNDFTLPNNEVADSIDKFTRNWEIAPACSTVTNKAHKCIDVDPASEKNKLCQMAFLNVTSPFRPLFDMVDPEPFYQMCVNDMCELETEAERKEKICEIYKAYLSQRSDMRVPMPPHCIKCQTSNGTVISVEKPVKLENPVKVADVIFLVENKLCAEDIASNLHDIAIKIDTELRRNNISSNKFGLVGFGGEGVHNLPHPHTIDGALFNDATRVRLGVEALEFADDGNNDTLAAILRAANYPFRAGASKNIILISCSNCQYKKTSYSTVAKTLVSRGIQFNMLISHPLTLKSDKKAKSSKERILGFDDLAVYTEKMAGQAILKGDQSLRKYITEPLNKCTLLAMETNGSVFNSDKVGGKGFKEVFVLRMVKYSQPMTCQVCKCIPNSDWVGESVCERCRAVTPINLIQAFRDRMDGILIVPKQSPSYTLNGAPNW